VEGVSGECGGALRGEAGGPQTDQIFDRARWGERVGWGGGGWLGGGGGKCGGGHLNEIKSGGKGG